MKKRKFFMCIVLVVTFASGCVTTGPKINEADVEKVRTNLKVKALEYRIREALRVNNIGFKVLSNLPKEDIKERFPYTGLVVGKIDETVARLFCYPSNMKGVFVIGVVKDSLVTNSEIYPGDVLVKINDSQIRSIGEYNSAVNKLEAGSIASVEVIRSQERLRESLIIDKVPYRISFEVEDSNEINAVTGPGWIRVTYGLLRFVANDDELAVIMGHEIAHNTKGHFGKKFGTGMVSGIIGGVIGGVIESAVPGLGRSVSQGISGGIEAQFSQDFEREADYFGMQYAYYSGYNVEVGVDIWERFAIEVPKTIAGDFLSTHPSSPERMVRIEKTVAELKDKEIAKTIVKMEKFVEEKGVNEVEVVSLDKIKNESQCSKDNTKLRGIKPAEADRWLNINK